MISVGSDYSGIGAFNQAMNLLGIKHSHVFACDMDRYARQSYVANYLDEDVEVVSELPKSQGYDYMDFVNAFYFPKNVYDRQIPPNPLDLYMTSPPCQAFSIAGKREGENDKRGILFYNSHEFIKKNQPRFFIFENVKGLLSHDKTNKKEPYGKTFNKWLEYLGGKSINGAPILLPHRESVPYHIYHAVLNATDYGIPQNRERVFIVGIRDDVDNHFKWPKPFQLTKRLLDVLEDEVDEKYFLSDTMVKGLTKQNSGWCGKFDPKELSDPIANTLGTKADRTESNYIKFGYINQDTQASQVYDSVGDTPTLSAGTHGYAQGYVKVKSATKKGYEEAGPEDSINFSIPESETRRGRVGKGVAQTLDTGCQQGVMVKPVQLGKSEQFASTSKLIGKENAPSYTIRSEQPNGVLNQNPIKGGRMVGRNPDNPKSRKTGEKRAQTIEVNENPNITNTISTVQKDNVLIEDFRIRRLTPRECIRLMDFPENYQIKVSDTQAYKQAGNSICVGVLAAIIQKLKL